MSDLKTVPCDKVFKTSLTCPYCDAALAIQVTGWTQEDDGTWAADEVQVDCDNEPPLSSRKWAEWDEEHGRFDFGDKWHRLHTRIISGLRAKFRFEMEKENTKP